MATKVTLKGNTFGIKEVLKGLKFRWDPKAKAWYGFFDDRQEAAEIASRWIKEGVYGTLEEVASREATKEKRYMIKESWIFNLEAMYDKCYVLADDINAGRIATPFKVANTTINDACDLYDLVDEAYALKDAACRGGVTSKQYGRIMEIVGWRIEARYATCMAAGMDEADAGRCFEDM